MMIALSLADSTIARHIKCSSRPWRFRTKVSNRTQCGSLLGSLNLSTHTHVEKVMPKVKKQSIIMVLNLLNAPSNICSVLH